MTSWWYILLILLFVLPSQPGRKFLAYIGRKLLTNLIVYKLGNDYDEPIISSADLLSGTHLTPMADGTVGTRTYHMLSDSTGKVMMFVDIGHDTGLHVIAIGGKSQLGYHVTNVKRQQWLEPVQLEGDFPKDFQVFCTKGKQMEVRQIFAPDTMVHFQEFCQSYNFELYKDTIYFSQAQGATDDGDDTTMVTDVVNFLQENGRLLDRL